MMDLATPIASVDREEIRVECSSRFDDTLAKCEALYPQNKYRLHGLSTHWYASTRLGPHVKWHIGVYAHLRRAQRLLRVLADAAIDVFFLYRLYTTLPWSWPMM
jgi:hypothetical protein